MAFAFILESVGGTEWLVLLGVVLIVVGPKNLPSAARKLGSIMSTLRRAADEFKRQLLSMDEEFNKAVNDAVSDDSSATPSDSSSAMPPPEGDPSTVPDSEDRAEDEGSAYDYNSPYPGHDYYDETNYQAGSSDAGPEMGTGEATGSEPEPAQGATPESEPAPEKLKVNPEKLKVDPYAVKITVSTAADKGKK